MLNKFATKKVLDLSKIKPLATNGPGGNTMEQPFTNWYVSSMGSGFADKTLMLYVHAPSLLKRQKAYDDLDTDKIEDYLGLSL